MVDAKAFREGVGRLLAEVQRIKSRGRLRRRRDNSSRPTASTSTPKLRDEVMARVEKLDLPSYTGFVMPKLTPVTGPDGAITDVKISYPMDLTTQMLDTRSMTR